MDIIKVKQTLIRIGLSTFESSAYIALLQIGKGSADSVASRAQIKRSTAYLALESLFRQGLVGKIPRQRKMLFLAGDPSELLKIEQEKIRDIDRILPLLRSITTEADYCGTRMYEGTEGLKSAYEFHSGNLRDTEFVGFFGYFEEIDQNLQRFLLEWGKNNARKNIKSRVIVPDHPSLNVFREQDNAIGRQVKVISIDKYPSNISIEVFDTFTRIVLFKDKVAIIIENQTFSSALKSIFEMIW